MTHLLSLSPTQDAVVHLINRFGMATTSMVRRSLYVGTKRGTITRSTYHLRVLTERGAIKRLPYRLGGYLKGAGECVYVPITSKARIPNLHDLDVTELFVRIAEHREIHGRDSKFIYRPEPWSHDTIGGVLLKPDAFIEINGKHWFVEADFESEFASVLSAKMNKYTSAYLNLDGDETPIMPQVIFTCHTPDRKEFIQREINKKPVRALFKVVLFDDAIPTILGEK